METKKIFSQLGFALFFTSVITNVVQIVMINLTKNLVPDALNASWFSWLLMGLSFYCIGFPSFLLMTKNLPEDPKGDKKKLTIGHFIILLFISLAGTYLFNIIGQIINLLIGIIKGSSVTNPLEQVVTSSSIIYTIIFAGILSPIIEELIFRGVMLNKVRKYGDKIAIIFTATAFGLYHGNFSQFFYATALGMIFAYVVLKTNRLIYSILLHMLINLFGSVIMPALVYTNNLALIALSGFLVISYLVIGIVFFALSIKKITLVEGTCPKEELPGIKTIYGNLGMIFFFLITIVSFALVILS